MCKRDFISGLNPGSVIEVGLSSVAMILSPSITHMLHGAGIFTYETGSSMGFLCRQILQHHGADGSWNN